MRKNTRIVVIGLVVLLLGAGVVSGLTVSKDLNTQPKAVSAGRDWSDDFDSYETGSALHGQGGWAGWDNNAAATGYITDVQARSSPNSLEGNWFTGVASDMVQQYSGYNTGVWVYTAWLYVPSAMTGTQFFILMNTYTPGGSHVSPDWSLQVEFNAASGYIRDFNNAGATLPLITNAWAQIRVEIDFDADVQTVFYDNTQFIQKSWKNGVSQGGAQNLACVDLYAGDTASTSVYWDDLSLTPPIPPLTCDAGGPYVGVTGQEIQFTGSADGGTPPYTWAWSFGDGGSSTLQNPTHAYLLPGLYEVTLTVTDAAQVTASDETTANITKASEPIIVIGAITGGKGISAVVSNEGDASASMVPWSISLTGGIILKGRTNSGSILQLGIGENHTITSSILGFGRVTITVTAGDAEKQATGFIFLFFALKVK
jgi:hypothetical protein